jgi:precorrin-2 dehydrogenase / sirohydrochlorin ferrochelatase
MLVLEGRRAVVVGGGKAAADRADELAAAGAEVVVVADEPGPEIRAKAVEGAIRLVDREWRYYDADGAAIVVAASGDPELDRAVIDAAKKADAWVSAATDLEDSTFVVPAVVRRGDFTFAVATSSGGPELLDRFEAGEMPTLEDLVKVFSPHKRSS